MDHNLNDESENIHNVDAFNDAINELNSDELATTNISDFEMEQGNSLSLEEYQGLIDQINDSEKALRGASEVQADSEDKETQEALYDAAGEDEAVDDTVAVDDAEAIVEIVDESSNGEKNTILPDPELESITGETEFNESLGTQDSILNESRPETNPTQADFEEFFNEIEDDTHQTQTVENSIGDSVNQRESPSDFYYGQAPQPKMNNPHHIQEGGVVKPGTPIDIRGAANSSLHAGQKAGNGLFEGLSFVAKGATALAVASGAAVYGVMECVGKKAASKSSTAISGASEWMSDWSQNKGDSKAVGNVEGSEVELDGDANLVRGVFEDLANEVKSAVDSGNFEQASEMISEIGDYLKEAGAMVGDEEFFEPLMSDLNEVIDGAQAIEQEEKDNLLKAIKEVLEAIKSLFSKAAETPSMS